ncbi:MAG: hypothetical protein RL172_983 [Bacteroidota bacterium]|jgi:CubicO group peptidase (beta-lactamase class C family)
MSFKPTYTCLKCSAVAVFMLICLTGTAQYNFSSVDDFFKANQKALGGNAAILVFKDGKNIYKKETEDFTIKSRAPLGASSQWLTAALVMTFVDEGKLSLDERVSVYIPILENYGKKYITLRHCLSQTMGIADNSRSVTSIFDRKKFESLEEEINSFAKKENAANPGASFTYGSMGLNIAARVMEVVSKKRFEVLVKQRLFTPLEMKNSAFLSDDNAVNPSVGAESTAADYSNFLSMLLAKGMYKGLRILSEKSVAEMQTIQTSAATKKYSPAATQGFEYGLGNWILQDAAGKVTVTTAPSLSGSWPYIDYCHGYTCVLLSAKYLGDDKRNLFMELKKLLDAQVPAICP